jgi:hypothetical protein
MWDETLTKLTFSTGYGLYQTNQSSKVKNKELSVLLGPLGQVLLKPGAHTAILVGRFRFRWMFSAKTISDRTVGSSTSPHLPISYT